MSASSTGHCRPKIIFWLAILLFSQSSYSAPVYDQDTTQVAEYDGATAGCYYNYQHYQEGDRIITNEPCLNCTCHNRMLMCYLRVCPFTKAIGQDCTVEKRPDQCCPVITCPEVPVQLLTSTTSAPATSGSTAIGFHDNYGCNVNERFYADGAQLPINPQNPCELCYCIRNRTTCVMQECTLRVAGCRPVYQPGVCCPVKYNCEYDEELGTTIEPTPGLIMTTTMAPGIAPRCYHEEKMYDDGDLIYSTQPCQHCYCFRGDIACAVQDCGAPMKTHGKNCTAVPPPEGECCPTTYECEDDGKGGTITLPKGGEEESTEESVLEVTQPAITETEKEGERPDTTEESFPGADNAIPHDHEVEEDTQGIIEPVEPTKEPKEETVSQKILPVEENVVPESEMTVAHKEPESTEEYVTSVSTAEPGIEISSTEPAQEFEGQVTEAPITEGKVEEPITKSDQEVLQEHTQTSISEETSEASSPKLDVTPEEETGMEEQQIEQHAVTEGGIIEKELTEVTSQKEQPTETPTTEKKEIESAVEMKPIEEAVSTEENKPLPSESTVSKEEGTPEEGVSEGEVSSTLGVEQVTEEVVGSEAPESITQPEEKTEEPIEEKLEEGLKKPHVEISTEKITPEIPSAEQKPSHTQEKEQPMEVSTSEVQPTEISGLPEAQPGEEQATTQGLPEEKSEIPIHDHTIPEEEFLPPVPKKEDNIPTKSSETPQEPDVTEDHQIAESGPEIPTQGPTGIPITDRTETKTEPEIYVTEGSVDIKPSEFHVPDSLITEAPEAAEPTYIPPAHETTLAPQEQKTVPSGEIIETETEGPEPIVTEVAMSHDQEKTEEVIPSITEVSPDYEESSTFESVPTSAEANYSSEAPTQHIPEEGIKQIEVSSIPKEQATETPQTGIPPTEEVVTEKELPTKGLTLDESSEVSSEEVNYPASTEEQLPTEIPEIKISDKIPTGEQVQTPSGEEQLTEQPSTEEEQVTKGEKSSTESVSIDHTSETPLSEGVPSEVSPVPEEPAIKEEITTTDHGEKQVTLVPEVILPGTEETSEQLTQKPIEEEIPSVSEPTKETQTEILPETPFTEGEKTEEPEKSSVEKTSEEVPVTEIQYEQKVPVSSQVPMEGAAPSQPTEGTSMTETYPPVVIPEEKTPEEKESTEQPIVEQNEISVGKEQAIEEGQQTEKPLVPSLEEKQTERPPKVPTTEISTEGQTETVVSEVAPTKPPISERKEDEEMSGEKQPPEGKIQDVQKPSLEEEKLTEKPAEEENLTEKPVLEEKPMIFDKNVSQMSVPAEISTEASVAKEKPLESTEAQNPLEFPPVDESSSITSMTEEVTDEVKESPQTPTDLPKEKGVSVTERVTPTEKLPEGSTYQEESTILPSELTTEQSTEKGKLPEVEMDINESTEPSKASAKTEIPSEVSPALPVEKVTEHRVSEEGTSTELPEAPSIELEVSEMPLPEEEHKVSLPAEAQTEVIRTSEETVAPSSEGQVTEFPVVEGKIQAEQATITPAPEKPESITEEPIEQSTLVEVQPEVPTSKYPVHVPALIPGEGNCLVEGQSYDNNSAIPPANPCQLQCRCVSSIIQCDLVQCPPPPSHMTNCMPVQAGKDTCCPMYTCDLTPTGMLESDNHVIEHGTTKYETEEEQKTIEPSVATEVAMSTEKIEGYPTTIMPEIHIPDLVTEGQIPVSEEELNTTPKSVEVESVETTAGESATKNPEEHTVTPEQEQPSSQVSVEKPKEPIETTSVLEEGVEKDQVKKLPSSTEQPIEGQTPEEEISQTVTVDAHATLVPTIPEEQTISSVEKETSTSTQNIHDIGEPSEQEQKPKEEDVVEPILEPEVHPEQEATLPSIVPEEGAVSFPAISEEHPVTETPSTDTIPEILEATESPEKEGIPTSGVEPTEEPVEDKTPTPSGAKKEGSKPSEQMQPIVPEQSTIESDQQTTQPGEVINDVPSVPSIEVVHSEEATVSSEEPANLPEEEISKPIEEKIPVTEIEMKPEAGISTEEPVSVSVEETMPTFTKEGTTNAVIPEEGTSVPLGEDTKATEKPIETEVEEPLKPTFEPEEQTKETSVSSESEITKATTEAAERQTDIHVEQPEKLPQEIPLKPTEFPEPNIDQQLSTSQPGETTEGETEAFTKEQLSQTDITSEGEVSESTPKEESKVSPPSEEDQTLEQFSPTEQEATPSVVPQEEVTGQAEATTVKAVSESIPSEEQTEHPAIEKEIIASTKEGVEPTTVTVEQQTLQPTEQPTNDKLPIVPIEAEVTSTPIEHESPESITKGEEQTTEEPDTSFKITTDTAVTPTKEGTNLPIIPVEVHVEEEQQKPEELVPQKPIEEEVGTSEVPVKLQPMPEEEGEITGEEQPIKPTLPSAETVSSETPEIGTGLPETELPKPQGEGVIEEKQPILPAVTEELPQMSTMHEEQSSVTEERPLGEDVSAPGQQTEVPSLEEGTLKPSVEEENPSPEEQPSTPGEAVSEEITESISEVPVEVSPSQEEMPEEKVPGEVPVKMAPVETPEKISPVEIPTKEIPDEISGTQLPSEVMGTELPSQTPEKETSSEMGEKVIPSEIPEKTIPSEVPTKEIPVEKPEQFQPAEVPKETLHEQETISPEIEGETPVTTEPTIIKEQLPEVTPGATELPGIEEKSTEHSVTSEEELAQSTISTPEIEASSFPEEQPFEVTEQPTEISVAPEEHGTTTEKILSSQPEVESSTSKEPSKVMETEASTTGTEKQPEIEYTPVEEQVTSKISPPSTEIPEENIEPTIPEEHVSEGTSIKPEKDQQATETPFEHDVTKAQVLPTETTPMETTEEEEEGEEGIQQHIAPQEFIPTGEKEETIEGQLTIGPNEDQRPINHTDGIIEEPVKTTFPERPGSGTQTSQPPEYPDQTVSGEDNPHFPMHGGSYLNPDEDYDEDDQAIYGPGTCRYGGKVYVSAQQIPRDDPCDFCFCFRSDIICLQQSCPPPIPACHEEPISGFCCPRYECPVSMATSLNMTTTTTTTTTTLPPHFHAHAYKGAAKRSGCQILGQAYRVGEIIRSASGPCLHCTCGGDGNMKCDPRICSPEPMLRQMIAAATARKRR